MALKTAAVVALVALVAGFFTGRSSVRVDDQKLRDSLAVYRTDRKHSELERDSLRGVILVVRTVVSAAEHDRDAALRRAGVRTAAAALSGARADSLERLLRTALTPAESLRACVLALDQRRNECAEIRQVNGELRTAIEQDSLAKAGLRAEIAAHLQTRRSDSANLVRSDGLLRQLEKNARGCRIPVLGFPCPTGVVNYDLAQKSLQVGGGLPVKRWLMVSVTTTVYKP